MTNRINPQELPQLVERLRGEMRSWIAWRKSRLIATTTSAFQDILAERRRQIKAEGWTPEHDDKHGDGELADAAACYAIGRLPVRYQVVDGRARGDEWGREWRDAWPWDRSHWKPSNRRRNLVKAGALIVAEIERIDRKALSGGSDPA